MDFGYRVTTKKVSNLLESGERFMQGSCFDAYASNFTDTLRHQRKDARRDGQYLKCRCSNVFKIL